MSKLHRGLSAAFVLLMVASAAPAAVLHVPSDYLLISTAFGHAQPGDTVEVAPGTYDERNMALVDGITLRGGGADPGAVILDPGALGRALILWGTDAASAVENLTIRNGYDSVKGGMLYMLNCDTVLRDCVIEAGEAPFGGAAWIAGASQARFERCTFQSNHADEGGAIAVEAGEPVFVDCIFTSNMAEQRAGAMLVLAGTTRLEGCTFESNSAYEYAGAVQFSGRLEAVGCSFLGNVGGNFFYGHGGALHGVAGDLLAVDCLFEGNDGYDFGAGIYCEGEAPGGGTEVRDCIFRSNTSENGSLALYGPVNALLQRLRFEDNHGPAFYAHSTLDGNYGVTLQDCGFWDNHGDAPCAKSLYVDLTLDGCTLADNRNTTLGQILIQTAELHLVNSLLAFNAQGPLVSTYNPEWVTVSCTNSFGNAAGNWEDALAPLAGVNGNLEQDPLFCDLPAGDLSLDAVSPCLPDNNDCGVQMGAHGQGCDVLTAAEAAPVAALELSAHPNPFNPATEIVFTLQAAGPVTLRIYGSTGRRVRTLLERAPRAAGEARITWDGRNDDGHALPSGVYLYAVEAGGRTTARKAVLLK